MKPFARINLSYVLSSVLSSVALAEEEALAKADALRIGILVSSLVFAAAGCILPIPHYRQHLEKTCGVVIDKKSRNPVSNARITVCAGRYSQGAITDSNGRFSVESSGGWHFIWWVAPPSGGSLLPTYLDPQDSWHDIRIEAQGYPVHLETPPWNKRGTYVIELDKERKDCKENPFLQNQWEGNSNEEVVDGGAGDGRNAPCGGK